MILEWVTSILLTLIDAVILIQLPSFNQGMIDILNSVFQYMISGYNFLSVFFDMNVVAVLFRIVLAFIAFKYLYHFVMWGLSLLKKFNPFT